MHRIGTDLAENPVTLTTVFLLSGFYCTCKTTGILLNVSKEFTAYLHTVSVKKESTGYLALFLNLKSGWLFLRKKAG